MLKLNGVEHVYPNGTRALDGVTIAIDKGMFGLLGPNGAGKSSLMKAIATLQIPTAGDIQFGDINVLTEPDRLRAVLGYLPQEFGVYPRVSAYDLLDYMALLKGIVSAADRRATVETLLVQTNLWNMRTKAVAGFSGGMRQRFGIAQALIGNPQLIIVDEPTAGLDPEERNRFARLANQRHNRRSSPHRPVELQGRRRDLLHSIDLIANGFAILAKTKGNPTDDEASE